MLKRVMFLVVMIVATATAALAQDADLINPDRPGIAAHLTPAADVARSTCLASAVHFRLAGRAAEARVRWAASTDHVVWSS